MAKFEVWQDGMRVAAVDAPDRDTAHAEGMHYLMQYAQGGE